MSKRKINVVWFEDGETKPQFGFVSDEELKGFKFRVGRQVIVKNDNILSNHTKGIISGFQVSSAGNALALVNWLDGAPPLRIRLEKLHIDQPTKIWFLVQRNETARQGIDFSTGSRYFEAQRGLSSRRYFSLEEAEAQARSLRSTYGHDVLVLETVGYCNGDGEICTIE